MNGTELVDFSIWLLDELEKQGKDVHWLSKESGMTEATIRNYYYYNRSPKLDYLQRILKALGKKLVIMDLEEK